MSNELQAHQHRMDWADTLADLIAENDEDGYVDVLSVEHRRIGEYVLAWVFGVDLPPNP